MAIDDGGCARALAPIALLGLLLAGCASQPGGSYGTGGAYRDGQGAYRVGRPYEIKGVWYYPAVDYDYDRTGIASWYGGQFEGRLTANGEIFDLNQLTAAHTTLPMPSIVQVTNLENGRSLQLRVNDRGPFVDGRLIDVSRRAAQLLGFESTGTTLVRVKVLKDESIAAAEEASARQRPDPGSRRGASRRRPGRGARCRATRLLPRRRSPRRSPRPAQRARRATVCPHRPGKRLICNHGWRRLRSRRAHRRRRPLLRLRRCPA